MWRHQWAGKSGADGKNRLRELLASVTMERAILDPNKQVRSPIIPGWEEPRVLGEGVAIRVTSRFGWTKCSTGYYG